MKPQDTRHRGNLSRWLSGLMFVAVGCVLAFTLARWPTWTKFFVATILLFLAFVLFRQNGNRVTISLKTMLLLMGLIACGIELTLLGGPWKEVHRFSGHEMNLAISADGKLVAASQGTSIEIRETYTGRSVQTIKMSATEARAKANQRWAFKMGFANNDKSLMLVDWQSYPCLFDIATGQELRRWPTNQGISALAGNGTRFITDSITSPNSVNRCNVFDVELDQPVLSLENSQRFSRFISPTGRHVLVAKDEVQASLPSRAELWNIDEHRLVGTIPIPQIHPGLLFVKFSSDDKMLAVPTSNGLALWDVSQCSKVSEWSPAKFNNIFSLEWSPDSSRLVAGYIELIGPSGPAAAAAGMSKQNAIEHTYLLDKQCQEIAVIRGASAAFSPSGDRIATVYGIVNIFDGTTGQLLAGIIGQPRESILGFPAILFSPNGDWLFHNGSPVVFHRTRSENWYGIWGLPTFWGLVLLLSALIMQLSNSICKRRTILQSTLTKN